MQQDVPEILKQRIYEVVSLIPAGRVSTYGDVAKIVGGGCDAQTVGFALNDIPKDQTATVPWQRVINAQGGISTKGISQQHLLIEEGIDFTAKQHIDLPRFRWSGPDEAWATEHGFHTLPPPPAAPAEQLSLL
ncbi:MAG: MGMT family protein [Herpetosiphonaceae bacterium]|nr:MGMT family protein [Herpetosiphonaceae bacterium]